MLFVDGVLPGFAALAGRPAQALVGLKDARGTAGYPVGSVHLYQLGDAEDDARASVAVFAQPVLVVTCDVPATAAAPAFS